MASTSVPARFCVRLKLPYCIRLQFSLYLLDTCLCDGLFKGKLSTSFVLGSICLISENLCLCVCVKSHTKLNHCFGKYFQLVNFNFLHSLFFLSFNLSVILFHCSSKKPDIVNLYILSLLDQMKLCNRRLKQEGELLLMSD